MKKLILLLIAAGIIGYAGWSYFGGHGKPAEVKQPPVSVSAAPAMRKDVPLELTAVGGVVAEQTVGVRSRIDSQVIEVRFHDGDYVNAGDVLFVLDGRAIAAQVQQQQANLARDRAQLANFKRQYDRKKTLTDRGFETASNLDDAKAQYEVQLATVNATQAAIDNMKVQLEYTKILAPISGRTGTINVTLGNTVKANDTGALVTINQVKPIRVQVAIPQKYLDALRQALGGGGVEVTALHEGGKAPSAGKLDYIDNNIDNTTGTFSARASFANDDEALWPGMFVTTTIRLGDEKGALTVPEVAIQHGQDGDFVFVLVNAKAEKRPVKVARLQQDTAVIADGLKEGEQVAVDGLMKLENGSAVTISAPAPAPAGAAPEGK